MVTLVKISGLTFWEFCTSCECNFLLCCKYFKTYFSVISLEFWLEKISPSMTIIRPGLPEVRQPTLTQLSKVFSLEPLWMSANVMINFWANINCLSLIEALLETCFPSLPDLGSSLTVSVLLRPPLSPELCRAGRQSRHCCSVLLAPPSHYQLPDCARLSTAKYNEHWIIMDRMKKRSCPGFSYLDGSRRLGDNEVNKENNDNNNKPVPDLSPPPPSPEWLQKTFLRSHSEYLSRQPARTSSVQVTDLNSNILISRHSMGLTFFV